MVGLATSQPSGHTSDRHKRSIFNMEKYGQLVTSGLVFDTERFLHLVSVNLTSYKFSLFFFLIPLYNFQIFGVFIINFCKLEWNSPFKKWIHMGKEHLVKTPTQHVWPNEKKIGEYFSKMWDQMKNSIVNKMSRYMFIWSRGFFFFFFLQFCDVGGELGIIQKRNVPNLVPSWTRK